MENLIKVTFYGQGICSATEKIAEYSSYFFSQFEPTVKCLLKVQFCKTSSLNQFELNSMKLYPFLQLSVGSCPITRQIIHCDLHLGNRGLSVPQKILTGLKYFQYVRVK